MLFWVPVHLQTPLSQPAFAAGQVLPQPPQFVDEVKMFVHTPPHSTVPAGQAQVVPFTHTLPSVQFVVQVPQVLFVPSGTPGAAPQRHRPPMQVVPLVQLLPQPPQFVLVVISVQVPLHSRVPTGQAQLPFAQTLPPEQAVPHAPQLLAVLSG